MTSETTPLMSTQPTAYTAGYWRLKVGSSVVSIGSFGGLVWSVYTGQDPKLIGTLAATTFTSLWAAAEGWYGVRKHHTYTHLTNVKVETVDYEKPFNEIKSVLEEILSLLPPGNESNETVLVTQDLGDEKAQIVWSTLNKQLVTLKNAAQEQSPCIQKVKEIILLLDTAIRDFETKVKQSTVSHDGPKSNVQEPKSLTALLDKLKDLGAEAARILQIFDFKFETPRSGTDSTTSSAAPSPNREATLNRLRKELESANQTFKTLKFEEEKIEK